MKVHRVELLIVDLDDLGADGVKEMLEEVHYPNHCIAPDVKAITTVEVDWSDDHPLNQRATADAEYHRLFPVDPGKEDARLKAAMTRLADELRMVSVRLANGTIGDGDIQRLLKEEK